MGGLLERFFKGSKNRKKLKERIKEVVERDRLRIKEDRATGKRKL